jgi:outer membrane protein assembly factor BamD (BamD/ComL family)
MVVSEKRTMRIRERTGVAVCHAFAAYLDHLLRRGNRGPRKHTTRLLAASCALALVSLLGCMGDKPNLVKDGPAEQAKLEKKQQDSGSNDAASSGWTYPWEWEYFKPKAPPPPADKLVLRGDQLVAEAPPKPGSAEAELAGAHELFRLGDYEKAARIFKRIANNTKNPVQICEEARYYEAESYRLDSYYPKAVDTYVKLLNDFPTGANREQSMQHIFEIANYWLDDTREAMRQERERKDGKRWVVWPHFVQFERSKPFLDEEGRAIDALEQVRYNDMVGPLADKALFLVGSVHFFNEDYKEADHYFSQLVEMHPNSSFATQAVELGIISKHLSTGGADYDGRKVAEARILVHKALNNYKELAAQKSDFLTRQLAGITKQQAEKDYKIAEFYRRDGHLPSAYFYYEIVRRRYPGTPYADLATDRMNELRTKMEKKGITVPPLDASDGYLPQAPREKLPPPRPGEPETAPAPRTLPGDAEMAPQPRPYRGPQ